MSILLPKTSLLSEQLWTPKAEEGLLSLYASLKEKFDGTMSSIRHKTLYNGMAESMLKSFNIAVSAKQCKSHMAHLKDEFNKAFDGTNKTGAGAPTFRHFNTMMKIFEGSPTLVAPVKSSVGRGLNYTVNGTKQAESNIGTRTRPSSTSAGNSNKKTSHSKAKGPIYKPWNQEIIEKQLQQSERQNEELRLMREGFEKRSEERSATIKELVKLATIQMQMQMQMGLKPQEVVLPEHLLPVKEK